ncbi:hypothetical protein FB451DRAFT_1493995 [Mycena latifolia]|nr:hypothetical protein FB451DRAFT_1493995 [Mycena latifolia]
MLCQPTVTDMRLNNTVSCLTPIIALLNELSNAFGTPFVPAISNTTLSLMAANVKKNKEDCVQFLENVYQLLCTIVNLHIKSEPKGNLLPATLVHVGKFTETLHKIHTFFEAQQNGSKIKHFFRQTEMKKLLSECQAGLREALEVFETETRISWLGNITQMHKEIERMHHETLELISTFSDGTTSDRCSSIYTGSGNSSDSISMLPGRPKIFHGRESELKGIIETLHKESPRIAILGAALIGEHVGLKPKKDLIKQVIQFFSRNGLSLLILDNMETIWEPMESRGEITMRGAEHPAKVQWTRPFLAPLRPLSDHAARHTFFDIADDVYDGREVNEVLSLTDNMLLVVNLIAHVVDFEGSCSSVLARWKIEKTALLSTGNDRRSSLDASIRTSLSSPRMNTGAKDLLSLLSILPDGLSDIELVQSKLPITEIMTCKATLLATSLAYSDDKRRLKSLVPIREHMQTFFPPSALLSYQLKHFHQLLDLNERYFGTQQGAGGFTQLASNVGNIHQLLLRGLTRDNPNITDTINCALSLNFLTRSTYYHLNQMFMDQIAAILPRNCDERLRAQFIIGMFQSGSLPPTTNAELLIGQARSCFSTFNDPFLESKFYCEVGYYFYAQRNRFAAFEYLQKALDLSKSFADPKRQIYSQASHELSQLSGLLYLQSAALESLAACRRAFGDLRNAIYLVQRAIKLLELCGITTGPTYDLLLEAQAETHLLKSEYTEARSIHTQISREPAVDQESRTYAWGLLNIAQIDIMIGASKQDVYPNLERAKTLFSSKQYGNLDAVAAVIYCDIELGALHLREGEAATAKCIFQTCFNSTWGNDAQGVLACMKSLANVNCWPGSDFDWASKWTVAYLGYVKKLENKSALHEALQFLGDIFQVEGDSATATALFTVALDGFTQMDIHRGRAECLLRLGDLAKGQGNVSKAVELWKLAKPLFGHSSQAKQVTQIDARLAAVRRDVLEEVDSDLKEVEETAEDQDNIVLPVLV